MIRKFKNIDDKSSNFAISTPFQILPAQTWLNICQYERLECLSSNSFASY